MSRGYEYDVIEPISEKVDYVLGFMITKDEYRDKFEKFGERMEERGIDIFDKINSFKTKEESLKWIKKEMGLK